MKASALPPGTRSEAPGSVTHKTVGSAYSVRTTLTRCVRTISLVCATPSRDGSSRRSRAVGRFSRVGRRSTSRLRFTERNWRLPTLATRNHTFHASTPTGRNFETGGAPAPRRDGMRGLSNLFDLFDFVEGEDQN